MSECIVCGKSASHSRGGALLCPEHYGDAELWIGEERAAGRQPNLLTWAARQRRESRQAMTLRLTPAAVARIDEIAAARGGISRNAAIEALIMGAGD